MITFTKKLIVALQVAEVSKTNQRLTDRQTAVNNVNSQTSIAK